MTVLAITRLKLNSYKSLFSFLKLSQQNVIQARSAQGLIKGKTITGWDFLTYYTVTFWENPKLMQHYMGTGSHLNSMRMGPMICSEMASVAVDFSGREIEYPSFRECESMLRQNAKFIKVQKPSKAQITGTFVPAKWYFEATIK